MDKEESKRTLLVARTLSKSLKRLGSRNLHLTALHFPRTIQSLPMRPAYAFLWLLQSPSFLDIEIPGLTA